MYFLCAINGPLNKSYLSYKSELDLRKGDFVKVPLGKREVWGIVLKKISESEIDFPTSKIKEVKSVNEEINYFKDAKFLEFVTSVANYYHYPLGQLMGDITPTEPQKTNRGKKNYLVIASGKEDVKLNPEQTKVYEGIYSRIGKGFNKEVLFGLTGSGKTYVYLKLIKDVLEKSESVLFLVPEINLTQKFVAFFRDHLPKEVEIICYNSTLSKEKKYTIWKEAFQNARPRVYIGSRSAIFIPQKEIGLIVIDEEHDQSFKQTDRCAYWTRDVASFRAKFFEIPLVLGSATPSFETIHNTMSGRANLHKLVSRYNDQMLPIIEVVKSRANKKGEEEFLAEPSINLIQSAITNNEQVIVFINRLGFSNFLQCRGCGHRFTCLNCDTTLRFFKKKNILSCAHCRLEIPSPKNCPDCWCLDLEPIGMGTERVFSEIKKKFPGASVLKFDTEEMKSVEKSEQALFDFSIGKYQILVGTQMISKGYTFSLVNSVIILGVDQRLNIPDFRAYELSYQLIQQVSGRAGRIRGKGKVIIESINPELPFWAHVKTADYFEFSKHELDKRRDLGLPPFTYVAHLTSFSKTSAGCSREINEVFREIGQNLKDGIEFWGPRPSLIEKKKNMFSWVLGIVGKNRAALHEVLDRIERVIGKKPLNKFKLEIDPFGEL